MESISGCLLVVAIKYKNSSGTSHLGCSLSPKYGHVSYYKKNGFTFLNESQEAIFTLINPFREYEGSLELSIFSYN